MPTGFASRPPRRFPLAGTLAPWFGAAALVLLVAGLYVGFFVAPTDHQQGDAYRIIYIHVPAAWMSMFLYLVMAFWAAAGLVFRTRLSGMMASALAPTGALFTFIALWTGSLWGKPTWGTWWVWDARLTSELILLFLYFGFMALQASIEDPRRADKAGAILALTGVVNIPIIYFSVQWWSTLHQGASVSFSSAPTMAATMFTGMLLVAFAFWMYASPRRCCACAGSSAQAGTQLGRRLSRGTPVSWASVGDFLNMGGYALCVWGSCAVTLGLLAIEMAVLVSRSVASTTQWTRTKARSMKPRHKRFAAIAAGIAALGIGAALVLTAFQKNLVFLHAHAGRRENEAPQGRTFRVGGLVADESVKRARRRHGAFRGDRYREKHPGRL